MKDGLDMLLQEICEASLCRYISDLPLFHHSFNDQVRDFILQIPDERYPPDEWNAALSYITGAQYSGLSIKEVKDRFNYMK